MVINYCKEYFSKSIRKYQNHNLYRNSVGKRNHFQIAIDL